MAVHAVADDFRRRDPWYAGDVRRRSIKGRFHFDRRQVAHLGQGPDLEQIAATQYRHTVAQGFDLAQDVRREENGLPVLLGLTDSFSEALLHERVQPTG